MPEEKKKKENKRKSPSSKHKVRSEPHQTKVADTVAVLPEAGVSEAVEEVVEEDS